MMLISSISGVDWCCYKWLKVAVDLEVPSRDLGLAGHVRIGRRSNSTATFVGNPYPIQDTTQPYISPIRVKE